MKKKDIIELQIEDLAFGGKGVAKHDGMVVFVEGGLPGDVANVLIYKIKSSFCEGKIVDLVKPSPFRTNPVCRHFDICGGCKWQNYEYDMQLRYKSEQLKQNLIRIGEITDPPMQAIIAARKTYFYRNKMEFSFNQQDDQLCLGLHRAGFFDKVFDIEKCHLQSEISNDIVHYVRGKCREDGLPAHHIRNHEGLMRFLVVREGKFTDEILVNIVTSDKIAGYEDKIIKLGQGLANRIPQIKSLLWTINSREANIAKFDMYPPNLKDGVIFGRDHIYEILNGRKFKISAESFFQTNSYQAQLLYDTIVEFGDFRRTDIVCDLYCGTGTIAIYLAGLVKSVMGIEVEPAAIRDAIGNAELNSATNVQFKVGKVEDLIDELGAFNKLIIDPPRAGLHPKALKGVIELQTPMIIYVSCNPSTLARDVKELVNNGYRLEKTIAVDMFPHTYHIESISQLVRQ